EGAGLKTRVSACARRGQTARHRQPGTVLDLVKAKPCRRPCGPALTRSARGAARAPWSGRKKARGAGRTKEVTETEKEEGREPDSVAHAVPRARTPHATWAGRREPLPFP